MTENPEQHVLDEIDELVNWQLAQGDPDAIDEDYTGRRYARDCEFTLTLDISTWELPADPMTAVQGWIAAQNWTAAALEALDAQPDPVVVSREEPSRGLMQIQPWRERPLSDCMSDMEPDPALEWTPQPNPVYTFYDGNWQVMGHSPEITYRESEHDEG